MATKVHAGTAVSDKAKQVHQGFTTVIPGANAVDSRSFAVGTRVVTPSSFVSDARIKLRFTVGIGLHKCLQPCDTTVTACPAFAVPSCKAPTCVAARMAWLVVLAKLHATGSTGPDGALLPSSAVRVDCVAASTAATPGVKPTKHTAKAKTANTTRPPIILCVGSARRCGPHDDRNRP